MSAVKASVSGDALGRVQKKDRESLRCKVHGGSGLGSVSCRSVWDDGIQLAGRAWRVGLQGYFRGFQARNWLCVVRAPGDW